MLDWGAYACRPCGWWWGSYHVEEHIWLQLFTCKLMFKLLKTKNRHPMKEVGRWPSDGWWARWQILWHVKLCCVTGHVIRAAMGTVWETWRVWPLWTGCVMGRPSAITSHHAHNTIWSDLFQGLLAFKTQQHTWPPAPILNPTPRVNAPCTDALSTAIDHSYFSRQWNYS